MTDGYPDAPRCRFLRRHRWQRIETEDERRVACSRCGFAWIEPRLFRIAAS